MVVIYVTVICIKNENSHLFPIPLKYIEKRSGLKLDPYSRPTPLTDKLTDKQTEKESEGGRSREE